MAAPAAAGRPRLAERDRAAIEQRLKDLETFSDSLHRRWFMIAIGAALLSFARLLGYVSASLVTIGFVAGAAVLANVALRALLRRGWYRWWHVYVLALFDVTLVAVLVAFYGPGGFIAGFYLAVLPYAFDQGRTVGDFLVLTAALAYIAAAALHGRLYGSSAQALLDIPPRVYLDTILFMAVALTLKRIPGRLIERIRISRRVLHEVEDGDLTARAPAARSDELGFLERSLNRTLEETAATIAEVQREAETVATFAEELTRSAEFIVSEGERAASEAADLRRHSVEQRELAAAGGQGNAEAARDAHEMRGRAQRVEADARVLLEAADRGRERVARAGETLMAIGHEVQTTAATVQELSGLSERIGGFAQTIAKIARQTHLLALNAAIEAARAEERGAGFAAVADQIRNLAAETGRSARDVTDLIADVQSGMAAVAHAMAAGEAQVRDVGAVANEARHALEDIHGGALRAADLGTATADIARRQVERIADLAAKITRVEEISVGTSRSVESLATATRSQIAAIREFHATSQQLTGLAARLRTVIARFSVAPPDEPRPQHHGPRGRSGS